MNNKGKERGGGQFFLPGSVLAPLRRSFVLIGMEFGCVCLVSSFPVRHLFLQNTSCLLLFGRGEGGVGPSFYSFGDFFVSLVLSCSTFFASFETQMPDDPPCIRAGSGGSLSPQKVKEEKSRNPRILSDSFSCFFY